MPLLDAWRPARAANSATACSPPVSARNRSAAAARSSYACGKLARPCAVSRNSRGGRPRPRCAPPSGRCSRSVASPSRDQRVEVPADRGRADPEPLAQRSGGGRALLQEQAGHLVPGGNRPGEFHTVDVTYIRRPGAHPAPHQRVALTRTYRERGGPPGGRGARPGETVRRRHRGRGSVADRRRRSGAGDPRPERRRQDHHRGDLRGLPAAGRGHGPGARPGPGRRRPPAAAPGRRDAAGRRRLPAAPKAGEMLRLLARVRGRPARPGRAAGPARADRRARTRRTSGCPAASSSGCRWRWPWSAGRSWCSWTSRPPGWTRRPGTRPGTWSGSCAPTGSTVVLTTHYMEEAERLADQVVVVDSGRVVADGQPGRADPARRRGQLRFTAPARAGPGRAGRPRCRRR